MTAVTCLKHRVVSCSVLRKPKWIQPVEETYDGYSREATECCIVLGYTAQHDPSFTLNLEARYGYWLVGDDYYCVRQER